MSEDTVVNARIALTQRADLVRGFWKIPSLAEYLDEVALNTSDEGALHLDRIWPDCKKPE
jgi:hypothetical protein